MMLSRGDMVFAALLVAVISVLLIARYVLGYFFVVVGGYSMYPVLRPGDVVVVEAPSHTNITIGDIVVYEFTGNFYGQYLTDELIIHEVIYIYYHDGVECLVTKGVNNPIPDPGYPQLCGRVEVDGVEVSGIPVNDVEWVAVGGNRPLVIPYVGYLDLLVHEVAEGLAGLLVIMLPA